MTQVSLTSQDVETLQDAKTRNWRSAYIWIASLFYFCQGFYMSGFGIYAYTRMADWGIPPRNQALLVAVLGLPLYLKFIPGLLSDRTRFTRWGRRKPYIFIGALLYLPGFFLLIVTNTFGPLWFTALLLILVAWMLVDSSLDALTVDITPDEQTTRLQGSAWGSRLVGFALGQLFITSVGPAYGWTPALLVLAAAALAQAAAPFAIREFPLPEEQDAARRPSSGKFAPIFSNPLIWLSLGFFLFFDARGLSRVLNIYLLTGLGWNSSPETMRTFGILATAGTLVSAVGALLASRLPAKWLTSFRFYAVLLAVMWVLTLPWLLVYITPENTTLIFIAQLLTEVTAGLSTALMLALTMRICPPGLEGFTFAIMTSVRNFAANALAPNTALAFSDSLGLVPSIFTLIPYGLLSLLLLYPLLKRLNAQAQPELTPA